MNRRDGYKAIKQRSVINRIKGEIKQFPLWFFVHDGENMYFLFSTATFHDTSYTICSFLTNKGKV